jgi:hypothetical protein
LAADTNSTAVLARLRDRVVSGLRRMPNYTCVETITREYFRPNAAHAPDSCDDLSAHKRESSYKLLPTALDRLRLDVAVTPARELYSWAGAREFETRDLTEIVGGGPIGTGAFGAFLMSIFTNESAVFTYAGETSGGGRALMEFTYRVAREDSHYRIRIPDGWVVTGYDGRILADPATNDLVELSIRTDELPPETGSCETGTRLDYHRVTIGDADVLLPHQTSQRFVLRNGVETENVSNFTACREYRGQSTLRFMDDAGNAPVDPKRAQTAPAPLPSDRPVTMELAAPLDTWTAAGGDLIALRLAKPIVDAARHVLVPAGAAVEARLVRVQRYLTRPARAIVVIKPESIERNGVRLPFPVLPNIRQIPRVAGNAVKYRGIAMGEIPMPNEIKFGVCQLVGDHVILPKGYRTDWFTAKP